MPRYTLLPDKKHLYHDGKTGFRHLKPGETVELSETAYRALSDKFVPEGTAISAEDVQSFKAREEAAKAEIAELKAKLEALERAQKNQSPATGGTASEVNKPATAASTAPTVTKASA